MAETSFPAYPHHSQVARAREDAASSSTTPTGWTREQYLDLAEPIVRTAIEWQDETGAIIDPQAGEETVTCGARFVGALAALIGAGRCTEHVKACARAMDLQTEQIAVPYGQPGHAKAADFNTRDLMLAILFVAPLIQPERAAEWRRRLAAVPPDDLYDCGANTPPDVTHNWVDYAIVGEYLKFAAGIADHRDWIERMLDQQLPLFTDDGMYRDPNCPITYDLTVRQGLSWMLDRGYDGPHRAWIDELLRRGALTTLLTISPTGEAPFGGRSNQFHHMEAMICCFCEFEAKRYARAGDGVLAAAFKRQAHLSARATAPWITETKPWRHLKNRFAPTSLIGCDGYGLLAVYGLLAANFLGVAYHMADETIPEGPGFSEAGGRVAQVDPEFHKVYATCRGTHLQIDTRADPHYDATGLGRFHRAGVPSFLGLSCPFAASPSYNLPPEVAPRAVAVGPGWRVGDEWVYLAELGSEIEDVRLDVEREGEDAVVFSVIYRLSSDVTEVRERYELTEGRVRIEARVEGTPGPCCMRVPLWHTDGEYEAAPEVLPTGFRVQWQGHGYGAVCGSPNLVAVSVEAERVANRNGIYGVGRIEANGNEVSVTLEVR
jgi:hypothetical protein